jgi:glycosyltransferase involved in cell wall biosynthesis
MWEWALVEMRIVINAASAKMGGAVSYITNVLRNLSAAGGDEEFVVFLPPETAAKLEGLAPNIQAIPAAIGHAGLLRRLWWEQVTLRRFLKKQKAGALFSTANFAMFFCPVRQLLLVRNAIYFSRLYREMFLPKHRLGYRVAFALRRRLIIQSVRAADVVMTPTQTMLDELRRDVNVKNAVVNPYGIIAPELPEKAQDAAAACCGGADSRVVRLLYVSLYSEHKNLATLLKALEILNAGDGTKFKLITTADPAWPGAAWTVTHLEDISLARRAGIAEWVEFIAPQSPEKTAGLYRAADIFVFPSLAESFGFPMAEAMSHGLPIVAADTPVNREVCGQAAIFFSPLCPEELAHRLRSLAADRPLCRRLAGRGRDEAARRFRSSAHARQIVEAAGNSQPDTVRGYTGPHVSPADASQPKAPVSVLILTRNEQANIAACLESVRWASEAFVVDSFSTDRTVEIAESAGARTFHHTFETCAAQWNWALDNLPFVNEWVLVLDADERVPSALAREIIQVVAASAREYSGYFLRFRFWFMGRWLRHGGLYPTWVLRLFRRGAGRFGRHGISEHMVLEGSKGYLQTPFEHRDSKPLSDWIQKHNRYAELEAEEYVRGQLGASTASSISGRLWGSQAERKRWIKLKVWNRLPLLVRPFLFFFRNYFLKLGFLDGRAGLVYHVLWSFWYPFLVSARILEKQLAGPRRAGVGAPEPHDLPLAPAASAALEPHNRQVSASNAVV